jgi:hypothetical protein
MIFHIVQHWKWYKIVVKKRLFAKNQQVLLLTLIFLVVAITGFIPWIINLCNGDQILRKTIIEIHDKIALILFVYLVFHVVKRLNCLKKATNPPVKQCKNMMNYYFIIASTILIISLFIHSTSGKSNKQNTMLNSKKIIRQKNKKSGTITPKLLEFSTRIFCKGNIDVLEIMSLNQVCSCLCRAQKKPVTSNWQPAFNTMK